MTVAERVMQPLVDIGQALDQRREIVLRWVLWGALLLLPPILLLQYELILARQPRLLYVGGGLALLSGILLFFRRIPYRFKAGLLTTLLIITSCYNLLAIGVNSSSLLTIFVVLLLVFAFMGLRAGLAATLLFAVAIGGMGALMGTGRFSVPSALEIYVGPTWYGLAIRYGLLSTIVLLMSLSFVRVISRALHDQLALTDRLAAERSALLGRVEESTKALTLTAEISRQLTTILDADALLDALLGQIQTMFGYYYVQVYLLEKETNMLTLHGGTGQPGVNVAGLPGRQVVPLGVGMVGLAASRGTSIVVNDISESNIWLPNPNLPKTQAEVALPIVLADEVIGVLDVHHHQLNGLTESDLATLETVASQLATALNNARLFEQAFQQATHEAQINRIAQRLEASTDVYSLVQSAAREIGQALGAQVMVDINLGELQSQVLKTDIGRLR
ncbi:MAG: GAF domain-containing protein [Anaerolineales bacterium]|nr:GAF domain-containing protein [Anaerolineales bacterium]MCB0010924.1 GAF domain-containing protein [Anaerolineales bacterium]MCB0017153.1 GAF domain-containing protein [Anaerolineales bacterium]MCB8960805.1 GAF domain-containing protein [Ardenticatenales bacterium]